MKIFRISNILALLAAVFLGSLLFWTSQNVQRTEDELARLKKAVAHEKESIQVLGAEWDYLNRPQRLEALAEEHLDLVPPGSGQMVEDMDAVPEPVVPALPRSKPHYTQPVSLEPQPKPKPKQETTISQKGPRNFDALLNDLKTGGGP